MVAIPDELAEQTRLGLKQFGAAPRDEFFGRKFRRFAVEPRDAPLPALLQFVLVELVGAIALPLGEKTAWDVAFTFNGVHCTLALQKFGLRLYSDAEEGSDEEAAALAKQIIGKLGKAARALENDLLRPLADEQLAAGNVTIANQLPWLRGVYQHFRDEAEKTFSKKSDASWPAKGEGGDGVTGLGEMISREFRRSNVGAYNTLAAVSAFFSYLEHALVLALPFTDFDPSEGRLAKFIGDRWGEKVKKVFDLAADAEAARHYTRLHDIAETYRNTYSHGGFDKEGAAVWVHVDGIGALPARLSDIRDAPHFELFPVDADDLKAIADAFDGVEEWLRTSKTSYGMRAAEGGLTIAYDSESRERYKQAMTDEATFERFLGDTSAYQDAFDNFEL